MKYPGMLKTGALSKYSENFSASSVALEIKSFKSVLNLQISFTNPNSTSFNYINNYYDENEKERNVPV